MSMSHILPEMARLILSDAALESVRTQNDEIKETILNTAIEKVKQLYPHYFRADAL